MLFTANEEATVHLAACFISRVGQNIKTNITDNLGANGVSLHFHYSPEMELISACQNQSDPLL